MSGMEIEQFRKLVKNLSTQHITFDEPHVTMRCEENGVSLELVRRILLESDRLVRLVEDRPRVYKLYYRLSRKRELKLVIDLLTYGKLNVRTVKVLSNRFRIELLARRRF